jgi:S1-C subfamily serine protease
MSRFALASIALTLCTLSGFVSAAQAQSDEALAAEAQPGPPITFSNLIVRADQDIGMAGPDIRVLLLETMRAEGLNALGAENLVFGKDRSANAELVLGGTVNELKCTTKEGKPECCNIGVRWELLDVASDDVVYRVQSRFGECYLDLFQPGVMGKRMLVGALRMLVNRDGFKAALHAKSADREVAPPPPATFQRCDTPALKMQSGSDPALDATVVIKVGMGHGSGFFLTSSGLVLTAAHVVAGGGKLTVLTHDGSSYTARVIRISKASDVALLAIDPDASRPLRCLAPSNEAQPVGKDVYVIGAPASDQLAFSLARGIVSGMPTMNGRGLLQTDAPVSPGNSGGPLVDESGRVLAVVSSKLAGGAVEGIGFGIPIFAALRALNLSGVKQDVRDLEHAPALTLNETTTVKDDKADPQPQIATTIRVNRATSGAIVDRVGPVVRGQFRVGMGSLDLLVTASPSTAKDVVTFQLSDRLPSRDLRACQQMELFVNARRATPVKLEASARNGFTLRGDFPLSALRPLKAQAPSVELRDCGTVIRLAPTQVTELKNLVAIYDEIAAEK